MRAIFVLTLCQCLALSTTLAEYKGYLSRRNLHNEEAPLVFANGHDSEGQRDSIVSRIFKRISGYRHKTQRNANFRKDGIIFQASDVTSTPRRHYLRHPSLHSPYSQLKINSALDLWRKMEKLETEKGRESKEKDATAFRLSTGQGEENDEDDEPLFNSFFSYVKSTTDQTPRVTKQDKVDKPVSLEKQKDNYFEEDEIAFLTSNGGVQNRQCPEGRIWKDNKCLTRVSIG